MRPIITEKAIMLIESTNTLTFEFDRRRNKDEIKKEFTKTFDVKVDKIRTLIRNNKKYAYIKLNKANPAIDLATKLGMI
ncbi:MAG: 50S ribosomal protein L23 [Nanoarchaeota archaeon]